MRIPHTPTPRFAGVYTFERQQADGSMTPITPEAVGDDDRLQAVLQDRMADAERDIGPVTSITRLLRVGDRLVGVTNKDLAVLLSRRYKALYNWLGLSAKKGDDSDPSADRVGQREYFRIDALADDKLQREGPAAQQAVAALEQGVLHAYLAEHPPQMLTIPQDAGSWYSQSKNY